MKRTVDEVKKKWKDLLSKAKKDVHRRRTLLRVADLARIDINVQRHNIVNIWKELPSVVEIANGIESASASAPLAAEEGNEYREYDAASSNETEVPISPENDERVNLSTSEHPEIGELEACSSEIQLQLVEG